MKNTHHCLRVKSLCGQVLVLLVCIQSSASSASIETTTNHRSLVITSSRGERRLIIVEVHIHKCREIFDIDVEDQQRCCGLVVTHSSNASDEWQPELLATNWPEIYLFNDYRTEQLFPLNHKIAISRLAKRSGALNAKQVNKIVIRVQPRIDFQKHSCNLTAVNILHSSTVAAIVLKSSSFSFERIISHSFSRKQWKLLKSISINLYKLFF